VLTTATPKLAAAINAATYCMNEFMVSWWVSSLVSLGALLASDKTGRVPIVSACCYPDAMPGSLIRSRFLVVEVAKSFYLLVLTI